MNAEKKKFLTAERRRNRPIRPAGSNPAGRSGASVGPEGRTERYGRRPISRRG